MNVLFLCSGNTCRSPIARAMAQRRYPEHHFACAGLHAIDGLPMAEHSRRALERRGLPAAHRSASLNEDSALWADLVVTMSEGHVHQTLERFPWLEGRVTTLGQLAGGSEEVPDPVGQDEAHYEEVAALIEDLLGKSADALKKAPQRHDLALGCDHQGFYLKLHLLKGVADSGWSYVDCGTESDSPCAYPDFARRVATLVGRGLVRRGLLVCGTGNGMAMAANKVPGIRAAFGSDVTAVRLARTELDANVLCVAARLCGPTVAEDMLSVLMHTAFDGGRHLDHLEKVAHLEGPRG